MKEKIEISKLGLIDVCGRIASAAMEPGDKIKGIADASIEMVKIINELFPEAVVITAMLIRRKFFQDGDLWLLTGTMRLWDGDSQFNFVFQTFDEMLNRVGKDCDYFKFWDENGHFFIKCSHHDGTNYGEIKYITPKGKRLIENWGSTYSKRYDFSARELYERIYKRYSTLPNYANKIYGCQKIEYKNVDKGE